MDAEYAKNYQQLYENHWWWRAREELIVAVLRTWIPRGEKASVLDIGCGNGLFFDRLGEFGDVEGIEADASVVTADGSHRDRIHIAPFTPDYDTDKRYDLILMLDVLEHLSNPADTLHRAVELLHDDGIVLITVPAFDLLWTVHDDHNHHLKRYTKRSFAALARQSGLRIHQDRYCFHWVFFAKLAVRLKETLRIGSNDIADSPVSPLNRLLFHATRFDEFVLGRLPVPFGSSLLVVGSKPAPEGDNACR